MRRLTINGKEYRKEYYQCWEGLRSNYYYLQHSGIIFSGAGYNSPYFNLGSIKCKLVPVDETDEPVYLSWSIINCPTNFNPLVM